MVHFVFIFPEASMFNNTYKITNKLNKDLTNLVFDYLTRQELSKVSTVSKFFNEIALQNARQRVNQHITPEVTFCRLLEMDKNLKELQLPTEEIEDLNNPVYVANKHKFLINENSHYLLLLADQQGNEYISIIYGRKNNNELNAYHVILKINQNHCLDMIRCTPEIKDAEVMKTQQKINDDIVIDMNVCSMNIYNNSLETSLQKYKNIYLEQSKVENFEKLIDMLDISINNKSELLVNYKNFKEFQASQSKSYCLTF